MGALPKVALPKNTIDIDGTEVSFRSLSRAEAMKIATEYKDDIDEAEAFIISCGVGVSMEDARQWRNDTDPITVGKLVDAIGMLSALVDPN